jgi:flagellar motor protein MotB
MPRCAWVRWLGALALAALAGCADNSWALKGKVDKYQQEQVALTNQNQQLKGRVTDLERQNLQVENELAQTQQQAKLARDQLAATTEQLRGTARQLSQLQSEKQDADKRAQVLTTKMQRQGSVSITPNNSLLQTLPAINLPDVFVRRDGDVIRIELPGNRLFDSGGATLRPGAANMIADAAAEIRRTYPDQVLGIEGHTDADPIAAGPWRNNHQLSIARAMAVYEVLAPRFRADQLFVVGHGANHPVVSNATPEGKQRNRRVELVVYPEKRG